MRQEKVEGKGLETLLEGILFAAGDPVSVAHLCKTLERDRGAVEQALSRLADFYVSQQRGIRLLRLGEKVQLCSASEYAPQIRAVLEAKKPPVLSGPALEVCSIVAYFQPVTRAYIDQIRGVDSAYTVGLLLERGLIAEAGRLSVPGRPLLYRTTDAFLRVFKLETLGALPPLPEREKEQEADKRPRKMNDAEEEEEN
ncbi:MAG: SMC-Scp complex subunit ScpB [Oscillospiraceae bacterium]